VSALPCVDIHYHRPPSRTDLYTQQLVYGGEDVKVTFAREIVLGRPLVIGDQVVLETGADVIWFTFPGAWHDIGRFHRADGSWTGIYANILTPCVFDPGGVWHTTDLFLDLWIAASQIGGGTVSGIRPVLLDAAELEHAEASGWVPAETALRARAEADRLVAAALRDSWPPPPVWEWTRERVLALSANP
jgi:predicted RNA-binding protein associated with RNAse of E/G family